MSDPARRRRAGDDRFAGLLDAEWFWSILAFLVLVGIGGTEFGTPTYDYAIDEIADAGVIAPIELTVPDPESTDAHRAEARDAVIDVYDFDPFAWRTPLASLNSLYAWGRGELALMAEPAAWDGLTAEQRIGLTEIAESTFGLPLPLGFVGLSWDEGFRAETELEAERLLRNQLQHSLIGAVNPLNLGQVSSIRVRDITDQQERTLDDLGVIRDLESSRDWLSRSVVETLDLAPELEQGLGELLGQLVRPNLNYNSNETQRRRDEAAASVDLVFYEVQRGRTIVREGDVVTPRIVRELTALREQWSGVGSQTSSAGLAVMSALVIFGLWRYVRYRQRSGNFQRVTRLYLLLLLVLTSAVLMTRALLFVGDAIARSFLAPPYNVAESYGFAIPFAAGALVLVLLADAEVAWIYAALQAVLVGAMTGDGNLAIFSLLSSFAVVFGIARLAERTAMLRIVLTLGIVNGLTVLGLVLLQTPAPPWTLGGFQVALGLFGAVQTALVASALLPPLEWLFGTLTDIKLLELSNMNLPLLKRLAVAAPGTYHHSVVIGTLTEKAAEAVGANPLFCRVASYYHDIGKMKQPEYFIENQIEGSNPHERLSPHMSALVLVRHVKEGIVYAEEHSLPKPLIDVIPQHHGTSLMKFFYRRAQDGDEADRVREEDFRYPGPKPQTKEAALIMLADGVEARSRLIAEPSPHRLQEMIRDQVRSVLEDGQLDECDLTLGDLARVEDAFLDVLSGMYHSRIEYPEEATQGADKAAETAMPEPS